MSSKFSSKPFIAFLHDIDPLSTYTITQLSGGLVNFTVRATKTSDFDTGFFAGHRTLVIKHALPFVASIGEGAPLSTFRQVVEKRALDLLKAAIINQKKQVAIPSVLHHDDQRHMLVITDLGDNLSTIDKWLESKPDRDQLSNVAQRLGGFLAALHGLKVSEETFQTLDNPDIIEAIERDVVERVNGIMDTFYIEKDESRALGEMVKTEYRKTPEQWVFSIGDLWIGSVLVSPLGETVAVVDWENAGRGKPLQDMAQFASHFNNPAVDEVAGTFIRELFNSYRREALSTKATWMEPSPYRDGAIESAWILHGGEIVYRAGELSEDGKRQVLAEHGLKYLRTAKRGLYDVDVLGETFLRPLYSLRD